MFITRNEKRNEDDWNSWIRTCINLSHSGIAFKTVEFMRLARNKGNDWLLGHLSATDGTWEIVVLHHTGCRAQTFENKGFFQYLKKELGVDVGDWEFLPFYNINASARDYVVMTVRFSTNFYDVITSGVVYDVDTGFITEVKDVILFDYRNVFCKK